MNESKPVWYYHDISTYMQKENKEVYCRDCMHSEKKDDCTVVCNEPKNIFYDKKPNELSWWEPSDKKEKKYYMEPSQLNENNDCPYFRKNVKK